MNERILAAIRNAKFAFPDQRIGQIIDNAITVYIKGNADLFYVTDEDLAKALENYVTEYVDSAYAACYTATNVKASR